MAFKLVALSALLAVANAGYIGSPITYAAPAAPLAYAAPIAKIAPAPLAYAAPIAKIAPAPLAYAAPIAKIAGPTIAVAKTIDAEYDANPRYSYAYDVQDSLTGDNKQQEETRNGDVVQGRYSLIEADGTRRIVDYTADPINGFNAVVHKEPAHGAVKTVVAAAAPAHGYGPPAAHLAYVAPAQTHVKLIH